MGTTSGPIGVFDSGVGGISVLKEMVRLMPNEDFVYFGDSQNAPYGTRPEEEIRELTIRHTRHLLSEGAKGICIACNTATSAAVRVMRGMFPTLPLVGLEPAIKPAVLSRPHPRVLVLATPATVRQQKLKHLISQYEEQADITALACPGLMEYVEQGVLSGRELGIFLENLLAPYLDGAVDCVVLGCTHYPFLRKEIARFFGDDVEIFDGGEGAARQMERLLVAANLRRKEERKGVISFENSENSEEKRSLCKMLLNCE